MANEKRLIDANALKKHMVLAMKLSRSRRINANVLERCIDIEKTVDAVEVVRCKDCKHFTEGMAVGMCKRIPDKPIMPMPHNNYCGFAERKNND